MRELTTAALTALFGVVVYVAGQAGQRFLLDPVQEQRKVLGEIAFALLMYGNVTHVAQIRASGMQVLELAEPIDVSRTLRAHAARLQQSLYVIPFYGLLALLRIVPSRKKVLKAILGLTAWSNSIHSGNAVAAQDMVASVLGIVRNE